MTKFWIVILITCIQLIDTFGCECIEDNSIFKNWKNNELIFRAEVIYSSPRLIHTYHSKLYFTDLLIKQVYKGELINPGDTLSVWNFGTSCDYLFNISTEYLVFTNPYILQGVDQCSGTIPWNKNSRSIVVDSINYYNKNYIDTIDNEIISNVNHFPKYKLIPDNSLNEQSKNKNILLIISIFINIGLIFYIVIKKK